MMEYMKTMLGVALALLAACGDGAVSTLDADAGPDGFVPAEDAGAGPTNPADSTENEAVTLDGVYSVPVPDPSLEPFSSQPVVLDWRDNNGQYRLDYDFPTDLTGVSQRIAFEGVRTPDGTILLSGDVGSASCELSSAGDGLVCTERFSEMSFDLERLQRDLERRGLPSNEVARRLEVAAFFKNDPIGILVFSLE